MRASGTPRIVALLLVLVAPVVSVGSAGAESAFAGVGPPAQRDNYELTVRSQTYAELFRRALLPGPNGALVSTDTAAPLFQYVSLGARGLDSPWHTDSLDLELSAWGDVWLGHGTFERRVDGDVQVANVRYAARPVWLRLGRQQVAGGAARFARFDGLAVGVELAAGLSAQAYGGFTVLPRWDAAPGYYHLGSAADSLLRDPEALPAADRSSYVLAGGRLGWASSEGGAGLSFHEQHEPGGLMRRNLGFDGQTRALEHTLFAGSALFELDAERIVDVRLWADTTPAHWIDVSAEYQHTEPALLLSRQSVLSVFSTDAYDEAGGSLTLRVTDAVSLTGGAWVQLYEGWQPGSRGEGVARISFDRGRRTLVRLGYARVIAPDNGYHSVRTSITRQLVERLSGTLEFYGYFYDEPIRSYDTSKVYAGTLAYQVLESLNVLGGASLAQSPYAALDAEALVRVAYELDASARHTPSAPRSSSR